MGLSCVSPRGAAAAGGKVAGEMCLAAKAAQLRHLLYLQGLIAQQIFGLFQPGVEKVIFWCRGEEISVIHIELALLQIDAPAEALYVPVLLALGKHLQPQILEQGIWTRPAA